MCCQIMMIAVQSAVAKEKTLSQCVDCCEKSREIEWRSCFSVECYEDDSIQWMSGVHVRVTGMNEQM